MGSMIEIDTSAAAVQLQSLIHEIKLFLEALNES
jgi:hypothetical protein